jgi:beta-glucanase (GH16 family)
MPTSTGPFARCLRVAAVVLALLGVLAAATTGTTTSAAGEDDAAPRPACSAGPACLPEQGVSTTAPALAPATTLPPFEAPTTTAGGPATSTTGAATGTPTSPVTSPPSTVGQADGPCGGSPTKPKDGGGVWTCSFDEEFNGSKLDRSVWTPQTTLYTGYTSFLQDCFMDSPNNVRVGGGNLVLTTRREANGFTCHANWLVSYPSAVTSGMVSTVHSFSQTYGRFEFRARVTGAKQQGLQEALWLWPVNDKRYGDWPASGEIDVAEWYHAAPDRAIPYVHYNNPNDSHVTNTGCLIDDIAKFHTYVLEWTKALIKITYDGTTCLEDRWSPAAPLTGRAPFDQPFFVALTQGVGQGQNAFNQVTTPLPASLVVDYVRVYK